ncbi:L-2-amino-thiazoline-4-carboxylic acid hydrolase [Christensenella sp. MSJ-20]|uniref:L-2-amino-thiazoline-4-carboxylic acid hydrolase n=1 Tax=Christensenella sp. MSJ-20 TaxID=2841518 RepID=UPI001C79A5D6|nr:L-2-amino-thiazoline-4-carboxylic acid hydrolase [Christensenella sp. MSJ-20]
MQNKQPLILDAEHHAALFGCLARCTLSTLEEQGPAAVREAVILYGNQRGARMAMRAKAAGLPLDMATYNATREWQVVIPGAAHQHPAYKADPTPAYYVSLSSSCPWHAAWEKHGMLEEGLYYCNDVDVALLHGFNPELRLTVTKLLTRGDGYCEMHWQDDLDHKAAEELVQERAAAAGKVMGWDYHMCHLYCSFISVLSKYPQCRSILNAAREMFEGLYGAGALDALTPWMTCNFASLPKEG